MNSFDTVDFNENNNIVLFKNSVPRKYIRDCKDPFTYYEEEEFRRRY